MGKLLDLLLFSCVASISAAQNNLPPVFEIKTDTAFVNFLPPSYWQILGDKNGTLSLDQVSQSPLANSFRYYNSQANKNDFSIHSYWVRYVLRNEMDHDAKIFLGSIGGRSDFHFIYADGKIFHKITGTFVPWDQRDGIKQYLIIPIELKPHEAVIIYNRLNIIYQFDFTYLVAFFPQEKFMRYMYDQSQIDYFKTIHDVFIAGVLAFASFFIFMFFIITHEKVYLYFSMYLFALSIGRFNSEMFYLFLRQLPTLYWSFVFEVIWFFPAFFLILFIRQLLNTKHFLPRWDRFLFFFNFVYLLIYLVYLTNPTAQKLLYFPQTLLALSAPVTFFMSFRWFRQNKVLVYIVLPVQMFWSICWSINRFDIDFGKNFIPWLDSNWNGFETILLCCLVI